MICHNFRFFKLPNDACDRNYEFALVETVHENRLEDKQIKLLKNIFETNTNL